MSDKIWNEWAEADITLNNCIDHLKHMGLSKARIKYKLVEKALEVCPPKPKPLVISKKMVNDAIKQFIVRENVKDAEILQKRKEGNE